LESEANEPAQPGAVVRAGNDPVAAELAAEYVDLGFQETDAGVAACRGRSSKEVHRNSKPAEHGLWILNTNRRRGGNETRPTFWTPAESAATSAHPSPVPNRFTKLPRFCHDFAATMLFMATMVIDLAAAKCMLYL
jgi:hypothetical protein